MTKKRNIVIGVVALLLVVSVGYALFSDTLNINGSAKAQGDFKMEILNASITSEVGSSGAIANVINDGKALEINVPRLEYPGAYVEVTYKIKNSGTIPAIFDNYNISGETDRIKTSFSFKNYFYDVNDERNETIRIYWDENNNTETEENTTIVLNLNFLQANDKEDACVKLNERADWIANCEITYEDNCYEHLEYDFDHDGVVGITDSMFINDETVKMQCPSN